MDKRAIRAELLARRAALSAEERAAAAERVLSALLAAIAPAAPDTSPPAAAPGADSPGGSPAADAPASPGTSPAVSPGADSPGGSPAADAPAPPGEFRTFEGSGPSPGLKSPKVIAAYVPIGAEPGGPGLPDALREAGAEVLLPVLLPDNDLDWAVHTGALVAAGRGMREPAGERLGVDAIARADLVIVPAVAVDRRGVRLGRGGGSYDRALARVPSGVQIVALLHDGELLDEVPAEPHDRLVSAVVTPSGGWCDLPYIAGSAGRSRGE